MTSAKHDSDSLERGPQEPPKDLIESTQFDLFRSFPNSYPIAESSNAIDQWESIPKYFQGAKHKTVRNSDGTSAPVTLTYRHTLPTGSEVNRTIVIFPAFIKQEDGTYRSYFPGPTEELVEAVLMKHFIDQKNSIHDPHKNQSWVFFTLNSIQTELKRKNRSRNNARIRQAIEILNGTTISIEDDGILRYKGSILTELNMVDHARYIESGETWSALLPSFYSRAINYLKYRQFNYSRYMDCKSQLARWLYMRLIFRYKYANHVKTYHISYNKIKEQSGLLQMEVVEGRRRLTGALKELVKLKIIQKEYTTEHKKEGRQIIDTVYTMHATISFINEQVIANERLKDIKKIDNRSASP